MRKRTLICLLCAVMMVCCLVVATACDEVGTDCQHQWTEATCTAPKTCSLCKKTEGEALGHIGGTATCEAKAVCTRCNTEYGELGEHSFAGGSCTEPGTCSVCGTPEGTAPGHKGGTATCEAEAVCDVCGLSYGEKGAHTWVNATCTAPKTCSVCGTTEGEALGHKGGTATCEAEAVCDVCGLSYGEKGAHTWANATCTAPKTCSVCGTTEGEALGHTGGEATCQAKAVCSRCNEEYGNLGAHDYDVTTIPADCSNAGSEESVCKVCGDTVTKPLLSGGHKYEEEETPATCTLDGVITYTCSVCGNSYSQITEKAKGHEIAENATWKKDSETLQSGSNCMYDVVESTKCTRCEASITRKYAVHKANYTTTVVLAANCAEEGELEYNCTCGDKQYSYKVSIPVNENAHSWEEVTEKGATHRCANCSLTKNEVSKSGTTAAISAEDLSNENVSIAMTDTQTVLQPDETLLEKMGDGVELTVETVPAAELEISDELKQQIGDTPIYNFGMQKDGQALDFDGGKMVISVPYELKPGDDPTSVTVLYIDDEGSPKQIDAVYVDGNAVFEAEHFSFYTVVRLTPAERCAKLGHDWQEADILATCTEDGYTVKHCRRCGEFETIDGDKALGHDFEETIVPATCTSKGYSVFACKNEGCKVSYTGEFTEMLEHNFEETVVDPTCTKSGYTLNVCSACGKEIKDNYVDALGHEFEEGICTVCGEAQQIGDVDNFYFKLLENIDLSEGGYISAENVQIHVQMDDESSDEVINLMQFTFKIDDEGYIVGKGAGTISMVLAEEWQGEISETVREITLQIVFANKKIYMYMDDNELHEGDVYAETAYQVVSQESIVGEDMRDQIGAMLEMYITEELENILILLKSQKDSPLNDAIAKVVEYMFDKTEKEYGFEFVLNGARLEEIVTILTTECGQEIFDRLFGENAYDSVYAWIAELPEKTVGDLTTELLDWILAAGVPSEDLFQAIDSLMNLIFGSMMDEEEEKEFSIEALLEAMSDAKVSDLLADYIDLETFDEMLAMADGMMREMPFADLVMQLIMMGMGGDIMAEEADGADIEDEEMGMVAAMLAMYEDFVNAIYKFVEEDISLSFRTTVYGKFLGFTLSFNEGGLDLSDIMENWDISINGTLEYVVGGEYDGDYSQMVKYIEDNLKNLELTEDKLVVIDDVTYVLRKTEDGQLTLIPKSVGQQRLMNLLYKAEIIGQEEYEGVECSKVYLRNPWIYTYILSDQISIMEDCLPTVMYRFTAKAYNYDYYLYLSANGVVGMEPVVENFYEGDVRNTSVRLYCNTVTKEFFGASQHNYMVIAEKIPQLCEEEGFRTYRCTNCADTYTDRLYKGHDKIETKYILVDEELGCEGGVWCIATCTICNKEIRRVQESGVNKDGLHISYYNRQYIDAGECGQILITWYGCVCGQNRADYWFESSHDFDRYAEEICCPIGENNLCEHGYAQHYIYTARCAVTSCAYTYIWEEIDERVDSCTTAYHVTYKFGDFVLESGSRTISSHQEEVIRQTEGDICTETWRCANCGKVTGIVVSQIIELDGQEYTRTLEYSYPDRGLHGRYEYDGCHYICTREEYGSSWVTEGFEHINVSEMMEGSCTQYYVWINTCLLCDVQTVNYSKPDGHNFHYLGDGAYICWRCGTLSGNDANGAVTLENLRGGDGNLAIGYFNRYYRDFEVEIYINYNDIDTIALLEDVEVVLDHEFMNSGVVLINIDDILENISAIDAELIIPELPVTVVFATQAKGDDPYPDTLEYGLTFSLEELVSYLAE